MSTTLSFIAPLNASSTMCINIAIIDDGIIEPCEDFGVSLTSDSERSCIVSNNSTAVQINDDEGECVHHSN